MVHDKVKQHADVAPCGLRHQPVEVSHGSVLGGDGRVIAYVVSEINLWRGETGGDPNRVHAQVPQVVKMCGDPVQVSQPVAVGVTETARIDFIDHGVAKPRPVCLHAGSPVLSKHVQAAGNPRSLFDKVPGSGSWR